MEDKKWAIWNKDNKNFILCICPKCTQHGKEKPGVLLDTKDVLRNWIEMFGIGKNLNTVPWDDQARKIYEGGAL